MYIEDSSRTTYERIYNGEIYNHRVIISQVLGYLRIEIGFVPGVDPINIVDGKLDIPNNVANIFDEYVGKYNKTAKFYKFIAEDELIVDDSLLWITFVPGLDDSAEYPYIQIPSTNIINEMHPDYGDYAKIQLVNSNEALKDYDGDKKIKVFDLDTCLDIVLRILCRITGHDKVVKSVDKHHDLLCNVSTMLDISRQRRMTYKDERGYQGH